MNQRDQRETERSGVTSEKGAGQTDDDEGSITSGSPGNLVLVAVVVGLLFFAGVVFHVAAVFANSHATRDNWQLAETILQYVSIAVFSAGLLVGLGTVATTRSRNPTARATAVASLLSKTGAAVVILGIGEAICILGTRQYGVGWQWEPSQVALRMGTRVFEGGVLAGLALLCLRQAKTGGPTP